MIGLTRRTILAGVPASIAFAGGSASAELDPDKARAEGRVSLYTSLDTQIVDAVIAPFTRSTGIKVEYFRGGSADVTAKVLAEADAKRLQVDMVDASDLAAILVMKRRGLLRPYRSPQVEAVPAGLRDPDGTWVADRLTQAVIQYRIGERGPSRPPATWRDLADPAYKGRLVFFSSSNGDGASRLYTLAKHFGWDLLKAFARNEPLRVQTPQVVTQIIESGERGAAFATNDNIAARSKLQGKPTDFVYPAEGVPTEPGAVGLIQGSARPNAAMLFYEWWMGKEGQEILVRGGKYSSRTDIAPPAASPPLSQLKLLTIDYAEYRDQRVGILERMTDIFGGEWGV